MVWTLTMNPIQPIYCGTVWTDLKLFCFIHVYILSYFVKTNVPDIHWLPLFTETGRCRNLRRLCGELLPRSVSLHGHSRNRSVCRICNRHTRINYSTKVEVTSKDYTDYIFCMWMLQKIIYSLVTYSIKSSRVYSWNWENFGPVGGGAPARH